MEPDEYICDDRMYAEDGWFHKLWELSPDEREAYLRSLIEEKDD